MSFPRSLRQMTDIGQLQVLGIYFLSVPDPSVAGPRPLWRLWGGPSCLSQLTGVPAILGLWPRPSSICLRGHTDTLPMRQSPADGLILTCYVSKDPVSQ